MNERHILRFALLASLATAACDGPNKEEADTGAAVVSSVPVETVNPRRVDLRDSIVSTSTVESRNAVDVMAEIPGTVVSLEVEQGDEVARGELLGRVSREELGLGVATARSAVARLEAEVERLRPLYEKGILPRQQFDEAKYRLDEARSEQRRANISASDQRVTAPTSGVVALRYVNPGQQVSTGTPLFRIVQSDDLVVTVNLPEAVLGRVFEKQAAFVQSDAMKGTEFGGIVEKVSPVVDPRTGTVRVTIDLDEPAQGQPMVLRPGMFVKAFIVTAEREDALAIPRRAVSQSELGEHVFVVSDGVARRREVELGITEGTEVEVLSGVEEGTPVVVLGKDGLKDGTAVDPQPRSSGATGDGS